MYILPVYVKCHLQDGYHSSAGISDCFSFYARLLVNSNNTIISILCISMFIYIEYKYTETTTKYELQPAHGYGRTYEYLIAHYKKSGA